MAAHAEVRVVAPVAWVAYGRPEQRFQEAAIEARKEGNLEVIHPRWLYPPAIGNWNGRLLAFECRRTVARIRQEFPFDIIDAHFGYPEGVAVSLLAERFGVPFTVTLRGCELVHGASGGKREQMSKALRRAARVIAVSRQLRDFAVSLGVPQDRTALIPNGIDANIFRPMDRGTARSRLGMSDGGPHILSAGHLIRGKGHHRIVEILPVLHAKGILAELWIVGSSGPGEDLSVEIQQRARQLGVSEMVHLMPAVSQKELAVYMNACDVFCLASEREGWPNVVHEAQACGAPVVATDVGAVRDMIPGDEFGLVVPVESDELLARGLETALTRTWDRGKVAEHGTRRSWSQVGAEVVALFRQALSPTVGIAEVTGCKR